jgi:hypothetical protein
MGIEGRQKECEEALDDGRDTVDSGITGKLSELLAHRRPI